MKNGEKRRKILKINMNLTIYANTLQEDCFPHKEDKDLHTGEKQMNKLNTNLSHVANYFVQLFYKTGQKYSCTQTKIGKLLSILAFLYARKGKILFNETVYRYKGCGAVIDDLKAVVADRDVYLKSKYEDFDGEITGEIIDGLFDALDESLNTYRDISSLLPELKDDIEKVFRKFGAHSAYSLGQLINPIVNHNGVADENDAIDLEAIMSLNKDDFDESNELIEYLFS